MERAPIIRKAAADLRVAPNFADYTKKGYRRATSEDAHLRAGLSVHRGDITCAAVAGATGASFVEPLLSMGSA